MNQDFLINFDSTFIIHTLAQYFSLTLMIIKVNEKSELVNIEQGCELWMLSQYLLGNLDSSDVLKMCGFSSINEFQNFYNREWVTSKSWKPVLQCFPPEYYLTLFRVSIPGGGRSAQGEKSNQRKLIKTRLATYYTPLCYSLLKSAMWTYYTALYSHTVYNVKIIKTRPITLIFRTVSHRGECAVYFLQTAKK